VAKYRSLEFDSRQAYIKVNPAIAQPPSGSRAPSSTKQPTPRFLIWPEDTSLAEENEIVLECLALNDASLFSTLTYPQNMTGSETAPQFFKYKWLKDGVALDLSSKAKARYQLVQGVNLRLPRAQETDSGTYTCRVCNSDRADESTYNTNQNSLSPLAVEMPMSDDCDERSAIVKVLGELNKWAN
jgi:hypothetical protein